MPRVTFLPSGRSFEVARGASLFRAVLRARLPLARSCRGVGVCALCRLTVVGAAAPRRNGDGDGDGGGLLPRSALEEQLARREGLGPNERFACLARVVGDVVVRASYW